MRKFIVEAIGTFALVFCGTGAIIINDVTNGTVTHVGIAMTFGLIVMVMIYAFGRISGAHINPAVSIAFSLTDQFEKKYLLGYIFAQLLYMFKLSVPLLCLNGKCNFYVVSTKEAIKKFCLMQCLLKEAFSCGGGVLLR